MFRSFCDPEQFLDLIKRRFDSQKGQRPALCRLLASWVESRLIPDFIEPFTNRKGQKGDRQRYNYIQLLFFISRVELSSQPGNDAATRIKLAILRAMEKRRRSSVGPQQQMAVAKTEQLPDKREQEYEERLFLVYVSLPPPLEVAQSISAYDACLMRQISGT